ncbi:oogenesis-related [Dunckerocampus dactyliophorus]|uniref:oogenesis-related n=1 Tax=Dunckerocampus dactyliophorus TaxID=161453 RepID=UPI0024066F5A|nr:oogenesis-related [Dunckerocampus dactyliophorus]
MAGPVQHTNRMTSEHHGEAVEHSESTEGVVEVKRDGLLRAVLRGLFWPFGVVVRASRFFWWVMGYRQPKQKTVQISSPGRQSLAGHKRLHPVTRLLLNILPRWVQGALGYPLSTGIGRSLSPEVRVSPTKPCGKGSKRKQDELDDDDDDDDEEEHQTWVEALNQELADEGPEEDPDYEPSSIETESEEYCSHNNTESDIEIHGKGMVIIEDVNTDAQLPTPQPPCPDV